MARRQMVLNMFYLRATEDLSPHSWVSILDKGFTCVTPTTPFRSFPPSEVRYSYDLVKCCASSIMVLPTLEVRLCGTSSVII